VDGEYSSVVFKNKKDVWNVIDLIIEETKEMNETMDKSFEVASSIKSQLPFFACNNIIYNKEIQNDIERYIYCDNFKTPAYPGCYDEQPARWVQKSFLIKKNLNKIQNKAIKDGTSK
jgi:hypothetical protein